MTKDLREIFENQYHLVFDEPEKPCGRDACKKLIGTCMIINPNCKKGYYGNLKYGFMEKENICKLAKKLGII